MNLITVGILALVQSVTEFLPISSSGHLVAVQRLLGLEDVPVSFNLILHLGTAAATLLVYHRLVGSLLKALFLWPFRGSAGRQDQLRMAGYLAAATAVTAVVGFPLRDLIVSFFHRPEYLPFFYLATGCLLLGTRFTPASGGPGAGGSMPEDGRLEASDSIPGKPAEHMGLHRAVIVGTAQAFAMLPGISRSGSTISAGLYLGVRRDSAAAFSFLLSLPAILGASLAEYLLHGTPRGVHPAVLAWGFFLALAAGYGALRLLLAFVRRGRLHLFAYYCFAAAGALIILAKAGW
ncbi:MAG: undecaprenyl-diphosphate phosphatase [Spirochaetota bacterium]